MPKRRPHRNVRLPWERQGSLLADLAAGRRWRSSLAVLAAVALLSMFHWAAGKNERERATRATIAAVHTAVERFHAEIGRCPTSTIELVHPPRAGRRYLAELPHDAWGRPIWVRCPGPTAGELAEVVSAGASGSFFDDDNIQ